MADRPQEAQNRIKDHGIIGDMRSAALIADTGSI
ncbi:glycosyl hydrolase family protein, partial [Pseudomonas syringae pv. actinidiae ICMP 19096]